MGVLGAFPVLAIVVAAYNVLFVFGSRAVGDVLTSVTFPSGDIWPITVGDTVIVTALALVLIELVSVGTGRVAVVNHALSALVCIICLVELFFVRGCGTPEFAVLTLIVGSAGFIASVVGAVIALAIWSMIARRSSSGVRAPFRA